MEPMSEKSFTIVDSPEMCTLAFLVNDAEEGTNYRTLQKLDCTYPDASSTLRKTFYLDSADESSKNIILLTIGNNKAFINGAIYSGEKFLVSKAPGDVGFKVLVDTDSVEDKDIKYTPNFKRPISIIDPEIPDEVRPVLYFDETANMVKAKVRLQSKKSYIALEVKEVL